MIFGFSYSGPELPLVVLLLVLMLLVSEGGYRMGRAGAARVVDGLKTQVSVIVTGTFALLALLLGFSLSMAVSRFDARQGLVVAEATVIGTAHLRARLLPAPEGPELANRLRRYVDLRLDAAQSASDPARMAEAIRASEALQTEMLATAVLLARQDPRSAPVDHFIEALKDIVALHERRVSGFESFVPEAVLHLLGLAALGGALLAGYGCGLHGQRNRLATTVHTVLVCLVVLVIIDLDRPSYGRIRVSQRSLERLQSQLATIASSVPLPADRFAGVRPVRYRCDDGRDVLAIFVQADPPVARIERESVRWVLSLQPSGSGARYTDGIVTFWDHHGEARLEREARAVGCRPGGLPVKRDGRPAR